MKYRTSWWQGRLRAPVLNAFESQEYDCVIRSIFPLVEDAVDTAAEVIVSAEQSVITRRPRVSEAYICNCSGSGSSMRYCSSPSATRSAVRDTGLLFLLTTSSPAIATRM